MVGTGASTSPAAAGARWQQRGPELPAGPLRTPQKLASRRPREPSWAVPSQRPHASDHQVGGQELAWQTTELAHQLRATL